MGTVRATDNAEGVVDVGFDGGAAVAGEALGAGAGEGFDGPVGGLGGEGEEEEGDEGAHGFFGQDLQDLRINGILEFGGGAAFFLGQTGVSALLLHLEEGEGIDSDF